MTNKKPEILNATKGFVLYDVELDISIDFRPFHKELISNPYEFYLRAKDSFAANIERDRLYGYIFSYYLKIKNILEKTFIFPSKDVSLINSLPNNFDLICKIDAFPEFKITKKAFPKIINLENPTSLEEYSFFQDFIIKNFFNEVPEQKEFLKHFEDFKRGQNAK